MLFDAWCRGTTISQGVNDLYVHPFFVCSPQLVGCSGFGLRIGIEQFGRFFAQSRDVSLFSLKACGRPASPPLSTMRVCGRWFYFANARE